MEQPAPVVIVFGGYPGAVTPGFGAPPPPPPAPDLSHELAGVRAEVVRLREQLRTLQGTMADLQTQYPVDPDLVARLRQRPVRRRRSDAERLEELRGAARRIEGRLEQSA